MGLSVSLGGRESAENSKEGRGFSAVEEAAVAIALGLRERLEMTFPIPTVPALPRWELTLDTYNQEKKTNKQI